MNNYKVTIKIRFKKEFSVIIQSWNILIDINETILRNQNLRAIETIRIEKLDY